jgi:hypothetical protein
MEVTRLASQSLPALRVALSVGRGGAAIWAAHAASDVVAHRIAAISGGAAAPPSARDRTRSKVNEAKESLLGLQVTPEAKAAFFTAVAMAFHYWGYSIARPVTVSLFTSTTTGYKGFGWAFPFAMSFVSPISLVLLMGYSRVLELFGPRGAIRGSTLFCAAVMGLAAIGLGISEETGCTVAGVAVSKLISGPLFVFREGEQLLGQLIQAIHSLSSHGTYCSDQPTCNYSRASFGPLWHRY